MSKAKDSQARTMRPWRRKLSASTPIEANRVLALLSKMFSLAIKWSMIASNPCNGVGKNPEKPRKRQLTKEEISRLIDAVAVFEKVKKQNVATCNAIRILMLTGARSGEVFSATWNMFELSKEEPTWTKPSSHSNVFLFPSDSKSGHLTTIKHAWVTILDIAKITDFRVHDVRHVFAALLAAKKFTLQMIGKLLGHTQAKTTERYSYLFVDDQREAVNVVAVKI
jgi:integrase